MGLTTFSGPVRSLAGFISGAAANAALTTGTKTLTPADVGKTQVVGIAVSVVTLPPATAETIGYSYNFTFGVNATAGFTIKTTSNTPGDKFAGSVYTASSGGSPTLFVPNGTTNDVIGLGGTKGGAIGSALTVTVTAAGVYTVSGNLIATAGPVISPFADA